MQAQSITEVNPHESDIELPLVKIEKEDVLGVLYTCHAQNELWHDALLKLQTWIINFAEETIQPLRDSGQFSDAELEAIKKKSCVISPITLTLYCHWLQMEQLSKMSDSAKEEWLLSKFPDRFKARYRGNAANRKAREVLPDEEAAKVEEEAETDSKRKHGKSFVEFLKEFGAEIRQELVKEQE